MMTRNVQGKCIKYWCGSIRGLAFAAVAAAVASCAAQNVDPSRNATNEILNRGGSVVTGSISKSTRSWVKSLGQTLPVCIAYRLPDRQAGVSNELDQVLRDIASSLREKSIQPSSLTVMQAVRKGGASAVGDAMAIKHALPPAIAHAVVDFRPVAPMDFRQAAKCMSKETILVDGQSIDFYQSELPLATVAGGEIKIDSVIFLELRGATPGKSDAPNVAERPS